MFTSQINVTMAQRLGQTVRTMACSSCATQVGDILSVPVTSVYATCPDTFAQLSLIYRPLPTAMYFTTCVYSFVKTETTTNNLKSAPGEIIRKSEFEFQTH